MFKNLLRRASAIALIAVLLAFNAFAQNGKYTVVRFAKGASSKVLTGKLGKTEDVQHFEVNAKAGQTLNVKLTGANARLTIYYKGSTNTLEGAESVRSWTGELPDDGGYVITVQSERGAVNYSLNISIR